MFRPLSVFIGLRYSRAKRRNHAISFFSLVSIIGIGLGVMSLITVLSVMNGFEYEIRNKIFSAVSHVTINGALRGNLVNWRALEDKVKLRPHVVAVAPFVEGQGVITYKGGFRPVVVNGILPEQEQHISSLASMMVDGRLDRIVAGEFGIALGQGIADDLGVAVGDKITIMTPSATVTPMGVISRIKRFTVIGIFHFKGNSLFNNGYAYIHLNDAQRLYQLQSDITGLHLKVDDLYVALKVASQLRDDLPPYQYAVTDWSLQYGNFFDAIRMEKTMMFIILILIVTVAAFNLVSSLVMLVTDKRSEIAILRTIGATPGMIMATFMTQGFFISVLGVGFGTISGVLLSLNATYLVEKLQQLLHTTFISENIYFIDYLPSRLQVNDVVQIVILTLFMGLLATIYPAFSAAKIEPAEALRYE